jgi:acyl transferase domain-containing protein
MPIALGNGHTVLTAHEECYPQNTHEEMSMQIAIVGMACRLPGYVSNLERFWDLCLKAKGTWSEVPKDRFSQETFYHPNPDKTNCVG